MCSWSSGSRGKKLVSLATISKVNTVNSEEEPCLSAQNYYCDEDVQMEEFIPITKSCVIDNGSMTIRYMDSADTVDPEHHSTNKGYCLQDISNNVIDKESWNLRDILSYVDGQANVEVEEKNIQNMEDDSRGDENRREPMKNDANQIIEETEIVEEENETKGYEEADPYETVEGHTKEGEERKRKKYKLSKEVRAETKKNKVISLHKVREGCINCKLKCRTFFTEEERNTTNHEFWKLDWKGKRTFVMNSTENRTPKRKVEGSKKNKTFTYFLKDSSGTTRRVCKIFFLTTLGYKKTNDWIIHSVWANANSKNQLQNDLDRRGRHPPPNKLSNKIIESHIDSFNPSVSHYRRVHAPNRLYLPSDLNVTLMFEDFKKRYPDYICSYEKYRKILKAKNISFAKLGNEECELCESYHMHNSEHKAESLSDDCEVCCSWKDHIMKAKESRERYSLNKENCNKDKGNLCFSVDLQKVIMLPRLEMFKKAIFASRLIVYNESFVPVGKIRDFPPFAVLWHEGISGRHQEDIISAFNAFLLHHRDVRNITLWLDNCSSQNKNWALFSFLVYIVNSTSISAETIHLNYFEPGHTFMSVDSFHHQVEESLKRQVKTYDFADFEKAVQSSNKGKVQIKSMQLNDFQLWKSLHSVSKIKKQDPSFTMSKITELMVKRTEFVMYYKRNFEEEWKKLVFLLKKHIGEMPTAPIKTAPNGFERQKVENLLKAVGSIMPGNRKEFWEKLPEKVI
ncbi:unnamed protein product [Acanthoscelides obtectus]|uniref:DUF7869 domain-containing protein n=1 Tax=Acanthoscelides obtectus TaxID=200917 RepID=A0A9P0P5K1_ACAOB|nr:unnamed protein product [Acanthoscelides obtectus]CAK1623068.1 hypothetical protein AOBTE_LOCUS1798 [Acanthoscelides obtectus]